MVVSGGRRAVVVMAWSFMVALEDSFVAKEATSGCGGGSRRSRCTMVVASAWVLSLLLMVRPPTPSLVCPHPLTSVKSVSHPLSFRRSNIIVVVEAGFDVTSIDSGGRKAGSDSERSETSGPARSRQ